MKVVVFTLMVLLSGSTFASDAGHPPHTLALFAGVTIEHGESLDTLGIEYAYRLNERWSLGGVIERADREKDSTLAIAFAHYWPYKGLFLGAGVGRKDPGDEREITYRATIGYEFVFEGHWVLIPQANIDFIEDHDDEEVYGIAFGRMF
jgi:hypothetical protein